MLLLVDQKKELSQRIQTSLTILFFLTGSFAIFAILMGFGVDWISILKLSSFPLFADKNSFAYASVRLTSNLVASFLAFASLMGIRARAEYSKHVAEEAQKKVTESANKETVSEQPISPMVVVVAHLDTRIARLLQTSEVIYWTIILSLVAGVFLIIFAGSLSAWDTRLGTMISQIEKSRYDIEPRFDEQTKERIYTPDQKDRIKTLDDLYASAVRAEIEHATREGKPEWNWPSTILRVGVIGMLVFLTQILISLYRYTSRLIVFYSSRRNALILANTQLLNGDVERLAAMLFPSNFDFGREPRHPLQEMMGFLRGARDPDRETTKRKRTNPKSSVDKSKQQNGDGGHNRSPHERAEARQGSPGDAATEPTAATLHA
jgi:hypothetical protein